MRAASTTKTSAGMPSNEHTSQNTVTSTTLHARWRIFVWITWGTIALFALVVYVANLPVYYVQLQMICTNRACVPGQLSSLGAQALQHIGISFSLYALSTIGLNILTVLIWFSIAVVLIWHKYNDWMALLVALVFVLVGAAAPPDQSAPLWQWPLRCVDFLAIVLSFLVFSLFPNGRFVSRWTPWLLLVYGALNILDLFPNLLFDLPYWLSLLYHLLLFSCFGILGITQMYRYRYMSNAVERQQIKWVIFSCMTVFLGESLLWLLTLIFPSFWQLNSLYDLYFNPVSIILILLIPISLGTAILRHRLWDVDVLINRTLVYGCLSSCVVAVYMLVVGYMGVLIGNRGNLLISLVVTGLVAVLFQPLRARVQRGVNHLLYGQRDEPYTVIMHLSQRLEATLALDAMLSTIVETVAQALKLPYVAILLKQGDTFQLSASTGEFVGDPLILPLVYRTEIIGQMHLASRVLGEHFTPADRRLLGELARQAGLAAHAVQLTADLQQLTINLQRSRMELVTTREEERRRLRRDLHDGLGSVLTSLNLRAGAIRALLGRDPTTAEALVVELQTAIRSAIADIRRLVYDLRPPLLDELGLLEAIREQAAHYGSATAQILQQEYPSGLSVCVHAPEELPALPAALEVATYRIVQEALSNVARHAHARTCTVRLTLSEAVLQVEITDDGIGQPPAPRGGVGLLSMRERAAELGGTCQIEATPEGGTLVCARLPMLAEPE